MNKIDMTARERLIYDIKDLRIDCSFSSRDCITDNFSALENPRYGKCFFFNVGKSQTNQSEKVRYVTHSGDGHDLELVLFVDHKRYLPCTSEAGFKLIIHDQTHLPLPETEGFAIGPGFLTLISVPLHL